jgi:uncharacterized protein HemY
MEIEGFWTTRGEGIHRGFKRAAFLAAVVCAGLAVWIGYTGRDRHDTTAFMVFAMIAVATVYCLLWMLGRIIAGIVMFREERKRRSVGRVRPEGP